MDEMIILTPPTYGKSSDFFKNNIVYDDLDILFQDDDIPTEEEEISEEVFNDF